MNKNNVIDSLGRMDNAMIESVEKLRRQPRKKRLRMRWIAVAACLAVLIVSAQASNGLVSNLLAPLYGDAPTEVVDDIGIPVGASVTVNGYTLTADAIIGDRHNIAVVYTLCRKDGQPMPELAMFESWQNSVQLGTGSGSLEYRRSEDGLKIEIIEQWHSSYISLLRRNACVRFENLVCSNGEDSRLLAEGVWELKFVVRYKDTTVRVPVDELEVIGAEGYHYQIHEISISSIGVRMELIAPNTIRQNDPYSKIMPDFQVSVLLHDGTVVQLVEASGGGGSSGGDVIEAHYEAMFPQPISLDTIKALVICGTTYEIHPD